jgi:hypothetical protein
MHNPEMPPIRNHVELSYRIMKLNALKAEQEDVIRKDIKEIYYSFMPSELLRKAWNSFKENPAAQTNVGAAGVGIGLDFLIKRISGRNSSLKGYLSSILFEKVAGYFLKRHSDVIEKGVEKVTRMFRKAA